ncbi:MAG: DUF1273 domain-containing protein [Ruminococcus sp.]|nr:DUF1273 domain-containing protein [Ruminococcus sp.]MCM1479708.1 DUF1273 domain-containing protein [Muribaculaceae bacterium]
MDDLRKKTLCFSGHRPEKLPFNGSGGSAVVRRLQSILYKEILDSISAGYSRFITGLARGVDLWAGEILMELKAQGEEISIIAVQPYKEHGGNFLGKEKFSLGRLMSNADEVVCLSEEYRKGCMQRRNEYMVDHSGKLIAVVSDYKSGTGSTIRYAQKQGIEVRVIDAKKFAEQMSEIEEVCYNLETLPPEDPDDDQLAF